MTVVAVDERAVDVEEDGFDWHGTCSEWATAMFRNTSRPMVDGALSAALGVNGMLNDVFP